MLIEAGQAFKRKKTIYDQNILYEMLSILKSRKLYSYTQWSCITMMEGSFYIN